MQHLARHDFGPGDGRLDRKPETALDCPVELARFSETTMPAASRGARRAASGSPARPREARGGVFQIELRDRLVGQLGDLGPALHAGPGGVDAVDDVLLAGSPARSVNELGARATAPASAPPTPPAKLPKPWLLCIERLRRGDAPRAARR